MATTTGTEICRVCNKEVKHLVRHMRRQHPESAPRQDDSAPTHATRVAARAAAEQPAGVAVPGEVFNLSQIQIITAGTNAYNAPVQGPQGAWVGDKDGTAVEHAIRWLEGLPAALEIQNAQLVTAAAVDAPDLAAKTKAQLVELAKQAGLPIGGTKADLVARIAAG